MKEEIKKEEQKNTGEDELVVASTGPDVMFYLRQRTVRINLIAMTLLWVISAFSFYTNNTFIKYVPGNF